MNVHCDVPATENNDLLENWKPYLFGKIILSNWIFGPKLNFSFFLCSQELQKDHLAAGYRGRMKGKCGASVILMDIGTNMWKDGMQDFWDAKQAIFQFIITEISQSKSSLVSLVSFGSNSTQNILATENEFQNIEVIHNFCAPSFHWIQLANRQISKGSFSTDPIDALIVGCEMLATLEEEEEIFQKTIILFTNEDCCPINSDGLGEIIQQFKISRCRIEIVICGNRPVGNGALLKQLTEPVGNGSQMFRLPEFERRFCKFVPKLTRIVSCMRGNLIVEPNDAEIAVQVYIKSSQASLPVSKKTDRAGRRAESATGYFDSSGAPVNENDIERVFKIGDEFVNTNEIYAGAESNICKGIHCNFFIPASAISEFSYAGNCLEIFPDADAKESNAEAFASFCEAMLDTETCCLSTYVRTHTETPKFGVLIPKRINSGYNLFFEYLPLREEALNINFPICQNKCTLEQRAAVREFVSAFEVEFELHENPIFVRFRDATLSKIIGQVITTNDNPIQLNQRTISEELLKTLKDLSNT